VPLENKKHYLSLLTDVINTQLHIICVLTGISEHFPDYRTCFFCKAVKTIPIQSHYVLFREFTLIQNNRHGRIGFFFTTFNLMQLIPKLSSVFKPKP